MWADLIVLSDLVFLTFLLLIPSEFSESDSPASELPSEEILEFSDFSCLGEITVSGLPSDIVCLGEITAWEFCMFKLGSSIGSWLP